MLEKIPGNVIKDSGEYSRRFRRMLLKVPGNVPEDFRESSRIFRRMFQKIPGNVQEDSGECSERFREVFKGNSNFQGILNWILQILLYHCSKQHKITENLQFTEQNIVIWFCSSLCLLRLVIPRLSQRQMFFSTLSGKKNRGKVTHFRR